MANLVNISHERYNSENLTNPKENGFLCRPVIIDIRKTHFKISPIVRDSASRDMELLKKTFQLLGFSDPYIINDKGSEKENHPLYSVDKLKRKLGSIGISFHFYFLL